MVSTTFVVGSLLVIMTPGPDLALLTRLLLTHRRPHPAVAAALGMVTAGAAHLVVGSLGLAALLATRPGLYRGFCVAGAVVLLVMAALALRSALSPVAPGGVVAAPPAGRAYLQGFLCTGTNPKVGLFLMAFLPQFIPAGSDPIAGLTPLAVVYLGLVMLWLLVWITLVRRLSALLHTPLALRVTDGVVAVVFTVFAVRTLLTT
ncbi:LysE family translocator [Actinokineospora terrae]|uniref:Threonine/homoserine/homoserine lactone efflux protein n=1 Tax=Actinokineospora terrae TaxID=155974 RepID=A0A1H9LBQ3_9PSEU|nr:LysE family transporter [Actinokineospora terrae]SER08790.1 Threonine/homoserine/homoserine lactone efflux protein [Actinokineospora terrae]